MPRPEPIPGYCGHCGGDTETQHHAVFCFACGKYSELDGRPIEGNAHHRGNKSHTFPQANGHGINDF